MDNAQPRARNFNAGQRIAELEAEVARLRRVLEEISCDEQLQVEVPPHRPPRGGVV